MHFSIYFLVIDVYRRQNGKYLRFSFASQYKEKTKYARDRSKDDTNTEYSEKEDETSSTQQGVISIFCQNLKTIAPMLRLRGVTNTFTQHQTVNKNV